MQNNRITSFGDHRKRIPVPGAPKREELDKRFGEFDDEEMSKLCRVYDNALRFGMAQGDIELGSRAYVLLVAAAADCHLEYAYRLHRKIPRPV